MNNGVVCCGGVGGAVGGVCCGRVFSQHRTAQRVGVGVWRWGCPCGCGGMRRRWVVGGGGMVVMLSNAQHSGTA